MDGIETEEITLEEYEKRGGSTPILEVKAVVNVIDKDGNPKGTMEFTSNFEDDDNADSNGTA